MAGRAGFSGLVPYLFPSVRSRLAHACHDSTATSVNAVNAVYQRASFSALPANSTALIKELREKSGAPISDVKVGTVVDEHAVAVLILNKTQPPSLVL